MGTDVTGTKAIPNGIGIQLNQTAIAVIGSTIDPVNNAGAFGPPLACGYPCVLVSGNTHAGIAVSALDGPLATALNVHNTGIGVDVGGRPLGNGGDGLRSDVALVPLPVKEGAPPGITGNVISSNGGSGINLTPTTPAAQPFPIEGNTITSNSTGGITLAGGANLQIDNNVIHDDATAIGVLGGVAPDLSGNSIYANSSGYSLDPSVRHHRRGHRGHCPTEQRHAYRVREAAREPGRSFPASTSTETPCAVPAARAATHSPV